MITEKDNQPGENGDDNGIFTDDNSTLQTKEEHEHDAATHSTKNEKVTPLSFDNSPTLGDKITVKSENEDILTPVVDDDDEKPNTNSEEETL